RTIDVAYEVSADGRVAARVEGEEVKGRIHGVDRTWVDLELDGLRSRVEVRAYEQRVFVNGRGWQMQLDVLPRFPASETDGSAQGPAAPLPGTVVAVNVQAGDRVQAGQTLVVLDAMKIEHRVL